MQPHKCTSIHRAIRTSRYTYVRRLDGPWLLFDDDKDPYQLNNLAAKPECHPLQQELDARLQTALRSMGDDFHPGNYYLQRWGLSVSPDGGTPLGPNDKPQSPKL